MYIQATVDSRASRRLSAVLSLSKGSRRLSRAPLRGARIETQAPVGPARLKGLRPLGFDTALRAYSTGAQPTLDRHRHGSSHEHRRRSSYRSLDAGSCTGTARRSQGALGTWEARLRQNPGDLLQRASGQVLRRADLGASAVGW